MEPQFNACVCVCLCLQNVCSIALNGWMNIEHIQNVPKIAQKHNWTNNNNNNKPRNYEQIAPNCELFLLRALTKPIENECKCVFVRRKNGQWATLRTAGVVIVKCSMLLFGRTFFISRSLTQPDKRWSISRSLHFAFILSTTFYRYRSIKLFTSFDAMQTEFKLKWANAQRIVNTNWGYWTYQYTSSSSFSFHYFKYTICSH